ncbi:SpoIIE family protein phosphatase [Streptomyces sp. NPDC018693]|uniref:SpoIIE family protein phosphatase n=1 Tax=unclassified Streptomyces TaxID=2593676 RepID=UPI0037A54C0A
MTSEPAVPGESDGVPELAALTRVVARQRAEIDRLQETAATAAVVERAKGAVMAQTGCSPDAAHESLRQRAKAAHRTLLEECWIVLGNLAPEPPGPTSGRPTTDAAHAETEPAPAMAEDLSVALGRLGRALVGVAGPQGLARCLLDHLAPAIGTDAVMLYARLSGGGLELVGHAGVDDTVARQWHQVPPLPGIPALDALDSGRPRWPEDGTETERARYPLIGDPPGRWRAQAWVPVVTGETTDLVIGALRGAPGALTARDRQHLEAVARLCAGPLRMFGPRQEPPIGPAVDAVRAVFQRLPFVAFLLTPLRTASGRVEDFRIDAATADAFDSLGRTGRELVGLRLLECWPAVASEPLWHGCLDTLATGRPYESEPFARQRTAGADTELTTFSARVSRLGDALVVSWLREDLPDRPRERPTDVPRRGSLGWATWNPTTGEAAWSSQVFTLFDRDPAQGPVPLTELPGLALPEDEPALARAVDQLRVAGRPCDVPFRVATRTGIRHLRVVAEAVADPHGTPVEVRACVQDLTAQRSAELALVASERAMLTQHHVLQAERTVAARLQHALLPLSHKVVRMVGLRVEVAYLPAQSGLSVGGDWFSAIELHDGEALFVVGDVAGHGMDAVATMAQLRFTAKGMVITGSSLTGALNRLNALLLHSRDPHGTATMVLARFHSAERRLVWAQAGHPPPLLLRAGRARYLERPAGMLLGACETAHYEEYECALEPGDRVVLYTDGLVERPGENIDRGLERLARALEAQAHDGPASLDRLLGTVLESEQRDDVCVLDLRMPASDEDTEGAEEETV